MHLGSPKVHVAGVTPHSNTRRIVQIACRPRRDLPMYMPTPRDWCDWSKGSAEALVKVILFGEHSVRHALTRSPLQRAPIGRPLVEPRFGQRLAVGA
jgi:hypothetical protein